jgi:hypothetical protein
VKSSIKPLEIPLASGCAQAASDYASPPAPRTVTNLRLLQRGGLGKRPGARGLAGTTNVLGEHQITGDGSASYVESPSLVSKCGTAPILGITSGKAFALDDVQSSLFQFCGSFSSSTPIRRRAGVIDLGLFGASMPASAVSSAGYVITAIVDGTVLRACIETPSGTRALEFSRTGAGVVQVRAHAVGTVLWLVWQEGANLIAQSFTPGSTSVAIGTQTTVDTLYDATYYWDTSSYDSTHWFMVHGTGSDDLEVNQFSGTTAVATAGFSTSASTPTPCSIWADVSTAQIWVGYYDDPAGLGAVRYRVYAFELGVVQGETTIATAVDVYGPPLFGPLRRATSKTSATTGAFYCFRYVSSTGNALRAAYTGNAWSDGTAVSTPVATWHVVPATKPDSRQRVWCLTSNGTSNFSTAKWMLLRWPVDTRRAVVVDLALPNMLAIDDADGVEATSQNFHAVAVGTTRSYVALPRVLTVVDGDPLVACDTLDYSNLEQSSYRSTATGVPTTLFSGSPVEIFAFGFGQSRLNGSSQTAAAGASEVGFPHAPTITATGSVVSGSIAAGTYSYVAVYEWTDIYGRRHRSAPSAPASFTRSSTGGIAVTVTYPWATQRNGYTNAVRVLLYRTLNGGTTYQRTVEASAATGSDTEYYTLNDETSDSNLSDEEFVYTDGGVLANDLAPSCRYVTRSEDRAWFGGLFDPTVIQCSKIIIPEEPIQCTDHPSHQVVLPGECTGLAYMDGQIAAFTRDSILLINSSSGPNDQGVGEFAPPRLHTTGLGCVDGRSVLETPEGIFFLSARGIELLPRGFGTVQFVGEAIKDLQQTSLLDQCGFSAYQADKNGSYARFGLMTGSSEFSVPSVRYIATFDLNTAQWFVDDYGSETMGAMGAWPLGFALVRTDLNSNTSPTPIWYEDGSLVSQPETTGAAYIDSSIVLNRLWPFGHAGWGKVRRALITFYSHVANWTLSLTVQTDENTAQTVTWSVTGTGLQWRQLSVVNDECSSIKITISDTDMAVNGAKQAATYLMCALESEAHDGLRLLASGDKQ